MSGSWTPKASTITTFSTPKTGYPAETDVISLTVVADDSVDGEIWTTRLFGQPADVILATLDRSEAIDGILIMKDGSPHLLQRLGKPAETQTARLITCLNES